MENEKKTGLDLLRSPFTGTQISKLPKATKKQNEDLKADYKRGIRCQQCGGWHLPDVEHLDYVGHAALTHRLLEADPKWNWEPLTTENGLPKFDATGGLWIKLTVCDVTRLGYGHAASTNFKDIGSREKEVIGDALRNAAMRFGAALDLWHKGGDLNDQLNEEPQAKTQQKQTASPLPQRPQQPKDLPAPEKKPAAQKAPDVIINHADLSSTVVNFGVKHKGKTFKEVGHAELLDYFDYLEKDAKKNKKQLSANVQKVTDAAFKWLENEKFIPPSQ